MQLASKLPRRVETKTSEPPAKRRRWGAKASCSASSFFTETPSYTIKMAGHLHADREAAATQGAVICGSFWPMLAQYEVSDLQPPTRRRPNRTKPRHLRPRPRPVLRFFSSSHIVHQRWIAKRTRSKVPTQERALSAAGAALPKLNVGRRLGAPQLEISPALLVTVEATVSFSLPCSAGSPRASHKTSFGHRTSRSPDPVRVDRCAPLPRPRAFGCEAQSCEQRLDRLQAQPS